MSKKSVELANHKRRQILKEIKENKQIETIELHHILNYKREKIGKPAVSQLQEGKLNLPKKERGAKKSVSTQRKGKRSRKTRNWSRKRSSRKK